VIVMLLDILNVIAEEFKAVVLKYVERGHINLGTLYGSHIFTAR
jgi:hypothetical protein